MFMQDIFFPPFSDGTFLVANAIACSAAVAARAVPKLIICKRRRNRGGNRRGTRKERANDLEIIRSDSRTLFHSELSFLPITSSSAKNDGNPDEDFHPPGQKRRVTPVQLVRHVDPRPGSFLSSESTRDPAFFPAHHFLARIPHRASMHPRSISPTQHDRRRWWTIVQKWTQNVVI